jgi:hypothetical protein
MEVSEIHLKNNQSKRTAGVASALELYTCLTGRKQSSNPVSPKKLKNK